MKTMVDKDRDAAEILKKQGLEQAILKLVDKNAVGDALRTKASNFLTYLVEGDDVSTAVEKAKDLALQIIDNPNDTNLVIALAEKLAFLANVAGSDARYT
eukprot:UN18658